VVIFPADLKSFLTHLSNVHFSFFKENSSIFMLGYRLAEKTGVEAL
jgi:hypothetical protein